MKQFAARSLICGIMLPVMMISCSSPTPTRVPNPTPAIPTRLTAAERTAIFETVWKTVNDEYYDPTFGGKDWKVIGDRYRQKLATVQDDATFWRQVLNPMLFELGVSHLAALPAELANQMDPMTFSTGKLGLDVRLVDGAAVITEVSPGFPADKAGLRPGYVIVSVDGYTLEDIAASNLQTPPNNERNRRAGPVQGLRALLFGETGKQVVVEYLDPNNRMQRATLQFAQRSGNCAVLDPSLPPACAEFESKRLPNGAGYVRFSSFLQPILESALKAIDDLKDAPVLIVDIRGNPGGVFPVRKAIASALVGEPALFMRYQHRDGLEQVYLDPVPNPFRGKVVILVDELSASSSEEFAGSLQALGRASVVGSRTPGRCLTANFVTLPKGAVLIYPFGQSQTPDGRVLEDNGVVPDIEVALNRAGLLLGKDAQLEAGIEYVAKQTRK